MLASLRGNFVKPHAVYRVVSKYYALLLTVRLYLLFSFYSLQCNEQEEKQTNKRTNKIVARLMLQFSFYSIVNLVLVFTYFFFSSREITTQLKIACKFCTYTIIVARIMVFICGADAFYMLSISCRNYSSSKYARKSKQTMMSVKHRLKFIIFYTRF